VFWGDVGGDTTPPEHVPCIMDCLGLISSAPLGSLGIPLRQRSSRFGTASGKPLPHLLCRGHWTAWMLAGLSFLAYTHALLQVESASVDLSCRVCALFAACSTVWAQLAAACLEDFCPWVVQPVDDFQAWRKLACACQGVRVCVTPVPRGGNTWIRSCHGYLHVQRVCVGVCWPQDLPLSTDSVATVCRLLACECGEGAVQTACASVNGKAS
jgi:hypothetical protein